MLTLPGTWKDSMSLSHPHLQLTSTNHLLAVWLRNPSTLMCKLLGRARITSVPNIQRLGASAMGNRTGCSLPPGASPTLGLDKKRYLQGELAGPQQVTFFFLFNSNPASQVCYLTVCFGHNVAACMKGTCNCWSNCKTLRKNSKKIARLLGKGTQSDVNSGPPSYKSPSVNTEGCGFQEARALA